MKIKIALPILVTSVLALGLVLVFARSVQETTHPALKQDLVSASGEKIVEITEASYQISENTLKGGSCQVRNLGGQTITGMGLTWTVTFPGGGEHQMQKLIDYRIHEDVTNTLGSRLFSPYEEKVIPFIERDPHIKGQPIEKVKVEVTFAVFEDSNGVGLENSEMYQRLILRREGAVIYKKWLDNLYGGEPKKVNRIVEILSSDEMPFDKRLGDDSVNAGAAVYKQWVLGMYKDKGKDKGEHFLKQLLERK